MYAGVEGENQGYKPYNESNNDLRAQAFASWLAAQGLDIPPPYKIADIPIQELPRYELNIPVRLINHNVPVDRTHVERLKYQLRVERLKHQLRTSEYQKSPIIIGYHDGCADVADGFHRSTALYELSQQESRWDTARCGVVFCTTEQFLDAKITSATQHDEVKLARANAWTREAYALTPWADKIDIVRAFQFHRATTDSQIGKLAGASGLSGDEAQKILAWVQQKSKIWGLGPRQIENMLKLADQASPSIIPLVREHRTAGQPYISRYMLMAIVGAITDHRLQEAVVKEIIAKDLDIDQVRDLLYRFNGTDTPTPSLVLSPSWYSLCTMPSRSQANEETPDERQELEILRHITGNLGPRIEGAPFDKHPDLRKAYAASAVRTYAALAQLLARESIRKPIRELTVGEGKTIYATGDLGNFIYLVQHGIVRLYNETEDGRKTAVLFLKGPALIGEEAFINGGVRTTSADTLSPTTLLRVHQDELDTIVSYHPDLAKDIIMLIVERMRILTGRQLELRQKNSSFVLARRLLELQELFREVGIPLSQDDLADYVGITRQAVGRIYQAWRKQHYIDTKSRRTYILDPIALQQIAQ